MGAVTGGSRLARFFAAAAARRVDVMGIGNSNQLQGGHGWDHGWNVGLHARRPLYATPFYGGNENDGAGSGHGGPLTLRDGSDSVGSAVVEGIPEWLSDLSLEGLGPVLEHLYADTDVTTKGLRVRVVAGFFEGLEVGSAFKVALRAAEFAEGGGVYKVYARLDQSPYSAAVNEEISAEGDEDRLVWTERDITLTATQIERGLQIAPHQNVTASIAGRAYIRGLRGIAEGRTAGWSHTSACYMGGQSLRTIVQAWQGLTDEAVDELLSSLVHHQGGDPHLLVRILEGLNARNDSTNSVGPSPTASNTRAGYLDNLRALRGVLEASWARLGYDRNNLWLLSVVDHPQEDDDATLADFRRASEDFARETINGVAVDLNQLISASELQAAGWYAGDGRAHLASAAAYAGVAELEIAALEEAAADTSEVAPEVGAVESVAINAAGRLEVVVLLPRNTARGPHTEDASKRPAVTVAGSETAVEALEAVGVDGRRMRGVYRLARAPRRGEAVLVTVEAGAWRDADGNTVGALEQTSATNGSAIPPMDVLSLSAQVRADQLVFPALRPLAAQVAVADAAATAIAAAAMLDPTALISDNLKLIAASQISQLRLVARAPAAEELDVSASPAVAVIGILGSLEGGAWTDVRAVERLDNADPDAAGLELAFEAEDAETKHLRADGKVYSVPSDWIPTRGYPFVLVVPLTACSVAGTEIVAIGTAGPFEPAAAS